MSTCFHCGEPIPPGTDYSLELQGVLRRLCCPGCVAVAATIESSGLGRFYAYRGKPNVKPSATDADRWSVYDRPALRDRLADDSGGGQRELRCTIGGLTCPACVWLLTTGLTRLEGVTEAGVDPVSAEAFIRFDSAKLALSRILAHIARLGFEPRPRLAAGPRPGTAERRAELKRLAVAGLGAAQVMTLAAALYLGAAKHMNATFESFFELISMLVATPVVLYAGAPIFGAAWRDLRHGRLGMDVPVALAIGAALGASLVDALGGGGPVYFDSAVMFVFFLTLGRFLEGRARHAAGSVFDALADLLPVVAHRRRGDSLERVGTLELERGERVVVPPGEAVPADGILRSRVAELDEALLSGESMPRRRTAGEAVLAGSLNAGPSPAEVEVTGLGRDTYVERIGGMLGRALAERPDFVRSADRVAAWFVAAVLAATFVVGVLWRFAEPARSFEVVLAMLVATCPCALSLATPAAFSVALTALARSGLLLGSTRVLERLADVDSWAFDKTGTLTDGDLRIARIATCADLDAERCLAVAAALDAGIEHPVARAFAGRAPSEPAEDVEYVPGAGVSGRVGGRRFRLGSRRFVMGDAASGDEADRAREVFLGGDAGVLARFTLLDSLRPTARAAVAALRERGDRVAIVSGDEAGPVEAAAEALGAVEWHADVLPTGKLALVECWQRRGRVVAAVGDGINDAPLLARADVSIAMVEGSRLAQASAGVVFTGDDLTRLPRLVDAARATRFVIRQNLTWAVAYNGAVLPAAALGWITPWLAALGMSLSSLIVVTNALRLRRRIAPGARNRSTDGERRLQGAAA